MTSHISIYISIIAAASRKWPIYFTHKRHITKMLMSTIAKTFGHFTDKQPTHKIRKATKMPGAHAAYAQCAQIARKGT